MRTSFCDVTTGVLSAMLHACGIKKYPTFFAERNQSIGIIGIPPFKSVRMIETAGQRQLD